MPRLACSSGTEICKTYELRCCKDDIPHSTTYSAALDTRRMQPTNWQGSNAASRHKRKQVIYSKATASGLPLKQKIRANNYHPGRVMRLQSAVKTKVKKKSRGDRGGHTPVLTWRRDRPSRSVAQCGNRAVRLDLRIGRLRRGSGGPGGVCRPRSSP